MDLKGGNCPICSEVLDLEAVVVSENVLGLLKFLIDTIDTDALQNSSICAVCLEKINEAVNFKISYLEKQKNSDLNPRGQETDCDETFVTCYICMKTTQTNSSKPLHNSCYENVVSYMVPKEDLENLDNFKICDGCHSSALNFQRMTQFLSVYNLNKPNNDHSNGEIIAEEVEFKIDIVDNCLPEDSNLDQSIINKLEQEIGEIEESEENFQKNMDCQAGPSNSGFWNLDNENQESSTLPCSEIFSANTVANNSYLTINITRLHINYKEFTNNIKSENDNVDEIGIFKCSICEFQAQNTTDLYKHAVVHKNLNEVNRLQCRNSEFQANDNRYLYVLIDKNINEVEMFKCQNCSFQTKYKDSLQKHNLIHKNVNEVRLFKCQNCQHQTKRKDDLKRHMLLHKDTNEVEMFKCQHCQYQTNKKGNLKLHTLIHKDTNEVKMFKCQNCRYQTKHKNSLRLHVLVHKNINEVNMFKCQSCQFQTKRKSALKIHALVHKNINEVEMFKCLSCEYQTKQILS